MVGYEPDRDILSGIGLIGDPGQLADTIPYGLHGIDIKNGIHILDHHRETFQPHSRIYVLIFKLRIIALPVPVKLGKDIIPDLHKAVAVTAHLTVRLSAAVFLSSVIIDLRAGTAGARPVLPEVIALPGLGISVESGDLFGGHAYVLIP